MKSNFAQRNTICLTICAVSLSILSLIPTIDGKANYRIELESFKLHKHKDYNWLDIRQARITKFNRTTAVFNGSAILLRDLPQDAMAKITCFERQKSQKYSLIPVTLLPPMNVCEMIKKDKMFYPIALKSCKNCPKQCPFKQGEYLVNNLLVEGEGMPDFLPGERWRCDVSLMEGHTERVKCSGFVYINRNN